MKATGAFRENVIVCSRRIRGTFGQFVWRPVRVVNDHRRRRGTFVDAVAFAIIHAGGNAYLAR